MLEKPVAIYINWAAYDELSDDKPLTEELAMVQFEHLLRLRRQGVQLDYYLMDAFWYARDGGYRVWRSPHWPDGPDRWFEACRKNGVLPGLWVSTNTFAFGDSKYLDPLPEWKESLSRNGTAACLFYGGFADHFFDSLQYWYDRGVRLFKFDFADFTAAPPEVESLLPLEDIILRNQKALYLRIGLFRQKNPDAVFLAYNGFGGELTGTAREIRKTVDLCWLDVFDAVYCGDPRPSDVPCISFWRAKDIYSDHMVRYFQVNGCPLRRIDNSGFMVGSTGTCYNRRKEAWKGTLVLCLARGGWANTYYGDLRLLDDDDAAWFAKTQALFLRLQEWGKIDTFGAVPGHGRPYGYLLQEPLGFVIAVVNPTQSVQSVKLPLRAERVIFSDCGFQPVLLETDLMLGPEQLAVVAGGNYSSAEFDLGVEPDVTIPNSIEPIPWLGCSATGRRFRGSVEVPADRDLRIIVRQINGDNIASRSSGGPPPDGKPLHEIIQLAVQSGGREVPVHISYDRPIWSGLSWATGRIFASEVTAGKTIIVTAETTESSEVSLWAEIYASNEGN